LSLYLRFGKRVLDLVIVIPALILLSPLFLLLAMLSVKNIGRPIFFKQRRAGKGGQVFEIYKFRSMTDARGPDGELLPDAQRIPPYGAFLRKSSLDELPGLFNVVKGNMSLVGPRPLLPQYLPYYSERHARRHEVHPGITGLAQINGRQLARFSERMEMDVWYVEHASLWTDLKILFMTIPKVLGSRGVVVGQEVEEVDDLGLSRGLKAPASTPAVTP
jgi:lipopolysaccharide/colanic/teichoic acid biosynthesis glycosyltransferase